MFLNILHLTRLNLQGHFPEEGYEDGFIADGYMRRHLTREGFKRTVGVRPDDLFIYTDGDELIEPEVLVSDDCDVSGIPFEIIGKLCGISGVLCDVIGMICDVAGILCDISGVLCDVTSVFCDIFYKCLLCRQG